MTVRDLIARLAACDPEAEVVVDWADEDRPFVEPALYESVAIAYGDHYELREHLRSALDGRRVRVVVIEGKR